MKREGPAPVEGVARDFRPLVRAALAAGWTLTRTRNGHPKITAPDGSYATPLPTAGGHHAGNPYLLRSLTSRLRKRGVDV